MKNYFDLKKLENDINFGFFTSNGGVSKGDYFSLNCSSNNNDKRNNVLKNIKIALNNLGIQDKKLKLINQIHSNKSFIIDEKNFKKKLYGDGIITKDKKIALGVLTADCAPVFIFDKNKKIICCLHSGWKGALKNIVSTSIKKIKKNNIKKENIVAVVGPCLGFKSFEVDKSFKKKFIEKNKSYNIFFISKNRDKDLFNLRNLINFQLKEEGIKDIYNIRKDTYRNNKEFFSHRKATQANKAMTGRMINIIAFKD